MNELNICIALGLTVLALVIGAKVITWRMRKAEARKAWTKRKRKRFPITPIDSSNQLKSNNKAKTAILPKTEAAVGSAGPLRSPDITGERRPRPVWLKKFQKRKPASSSARPKKGEK